MERLGNWQRILMEVLFDQILGLSVLFKKDWWFTRHLTTETLKNKKEEEKKTKKLFYCE